VEREKSGRSFAWRGGIRVIAEYRDDAIHRLRAAEGHLKAVERMVAEERYCVDVMKQLAAVQASLEAVQQVLLKNHLSTCVSDAIRAGSGESLIHELVEALRYSKGIPAADGGLRPRGTTPHSEGR
jgi:DNA-binding FrmR family transcriptional regulator